MCSKARDAEQSTEQQADIMFLSRIARKQTADRQEDPAEFLLNAARLRICLSSAAKLLARATLQGVFDLNHLWIIAVNAL